MARPAGSQDKNRRFLDSRLKAMFGEDFDPIMRAAKQAEKLDKAVEEAEKRLEQLKTEDPVEAAKQGPPLGAINASINAWLRIGEFIHPKLKATELKLGGDVVEELSDLMDETGAASHGEAAEHATH